MKIHKIKLSRINPATYNPRKDLKPEHPEYKRLLKSMDEYGCVEPLVWNSRTGNLVGGHQRLKILLAKGIKESYVSIVDLPLEKEKALNVALNKISGQWDTEKLNALLDDLLKIDDFDIELTGFDLPDIENMLTDTLKQQESDESFDIDKELDSDAEAVTKPGDVIELGLHGEHRLICGDVTKPADVTALLGQFRAQLCHADPPYGVSYDRRNRPTSKEQKEKKNEGDSGTGKQTRDNLSK